MDASSRRPQLPALAYLDVDKVKREEEAAYQTRNTGGAGTPQSLSTSAAASPTYQYPPGPPPPYSHAPSAPGVPAQHENTWPGAQQAVHTPPESRRTSEHEKEDAKQQQQQPPPPRQSLPSISEALGVDTQTSFAPPAPAPPPLQPAHLPLPQSAGPTSPSPTSRRAYPMDPPQGPPTSLTNGNGYSTYSQHRSGSISQPSYPPPLEVTRPPAAYPPVQEHKPAISLQPSQHPRPPPVLPFTRAPEPSPTYENAPPQQNGSAGVPGTFAYGYQPYPPRYANPTPPASNSSGPIYQPSIYAPAQSAADGWKTESNSRYDDHHSGQASYGENVKRHLDFYDLEQALNDIASASGILSDFSRRYGDRMHQTQRSGPSLSTLPGIVEVDDMVAKSRHQLDSLLKIRDVILAQQAVFEQQAADQRQHKAFSEATQPPPELHQQQEMDENKAGFVGVDTKKRRGRAAPPGRCHSCNRAETPEWRRGPDGARTLCNACGLHYAKLTRKNNGVNKSTGAVGSSNLRPKENMP